jgi:P-type E1-E2 ATPase
MSTTDSTGLTSNEAAARAARGESNRARGTARADYLAIGRRHLFTVFNAVVVPTAVLLFAYDEWRAAVSVSLTALANTLIGLLQELRAKWQLDRLAILTARKATVVRDGAPLEVRAEDVVLGDVLLLRAGDTVVADGTVVAADHLEVDEALLTGESDPVRRGPGDRVLSGSACVTGEGRYRADKVGRAAFAQSVTADARRYSYTTSPMTRALNAIVTALSVVAFLLCAFYAALYALGTVTAEAALLMVAATVVSMIPQGLVLTATVAFTVGAVVIGRRGALVQRLNAVEAMAAVDVICTDKTGTLTTNRLRLERVHPVADLSDADVRHRLALFAGATIDRDNKNVVAVRAAVGEVPAEVLDKLPFSSRTRFSAVRVRDAGTERVLVLGAPEALAPEGAPWGDELAALQNAGLRVLAFAEVRGALPALEPHVVPAGAVPVALVALADELRSDAAEVLRALAAQGIAFKAISGDNPQTVAATVAPLNLPLSHEPVVTGKDLEAAADPVAFARAHSVFGRVEPLQKVQIVEALQAGGANVAMIGDGVNDVLPIKKADLGIAMGEGTAAAKQVSSLVLQENSFAVLPECVAEGRAIVRNLRRAAKLFLVKNVYSCVLVTAYAVGFADMPFPYLPQQVSLLNWMVIGVPALLIALSRERPTRANKTPFVRDAGGFALRTGLCFGAAGLVLLALAKHAWGMDEAAQRTALLTLLIALSVTVLWRVLGGDGEGVRTDRWLRLAALTVLPLYAVAMYWPLAADFFRLSAPGAADWAKVLLVAAPAALAAHWWEPRAVAPAPRAEN